MPIHIYKCPCLPALIFILSIFSTPRSLLSVLLPYSPLSTPNYVLFYNHVRPHT